MTPKNYSQMMAYLTRPAMAQGGRIGFYKGEKVVKSHGKQIKDLTEAGESSVSIAKKLRLKQQTVNAAMDAMDKGIAGKEFKLSKPRKDIVKKNVNQTGINLKDPKHLEEVIKYIDDNPKANQKDAVKIFGRRKAELVDAKFYGSPGKKWSDEKAKLRNKTRLELTKERSSPSLEKELGAPKKSGLNFHHAGFKKSLADLKNTMYIPGRPNRQMAKLFEDPLLKEMEAFTKVFDDVDASPLEKQKAATDYLKNDRALRQKYPQFKNFKTRLSFRRTSLDPSGIMFKEKLPDPSLAISQEPGMTLKGETPSTRRGKQILEIANIKRLASFGDGSCAVQFGENKKDGGRIGYATGAASLSSCLESGAKNLNEGKFKTADQVQDAARLLGGGKNVLRGLFKYGVLPEAAFIAGESLYRTALGEKPFNAVKKSIDSFTLGLTDFTSGIEAKKFGRDADRKLAVDKFRNSQASVDSLQKKLANLESITDQAGEGYVGDLTSDIQMTQAQLKAAKNELRKNTVSSDIVQFIDRKALDIADAQTAKSDSAKQSLKDQMEGIPGIRDYTDTESIRIFPKQPSQMDLNLKMLPRMPTDLFTATPSGIEDYAKQLKQQGLDAAPRDVEAYRDLLKLMSLSESAGAFSPEQVYGASGVFSQPLAGGGIAKMAGVSSGPPPESGPNSQGLPGLLKRVRNL